MHHHCMCAPPHSLHRLYRPVLLLSANMCVYHIAYVYTRTPLFGEPPPHPCTHKGSVSLHAYNHTDQNQKKSNKMYLGLYTRVSTHLIMARFKGKEAGTTNQTRACGRTETIRDILAKNSLVYLFSLLSYAAYPICGEIRPY